MGTDSVAAVFAAGAVRGEALDGRVRLDTGLLKGLRKQRGISQETLAELCFSRNLCVSIASIKRAETGKPVLYRTARHLATLFDIDVAALVDDAEASATTPRALQEPPRAMDHGVHHIDTIRYVVELQVLLETPPRPAAASPVAAPAPVEELMQLTRQFGGVTTSHHGDRVVVYFGLPQAYRSDAERALQCALALCDAGVSRRGHAIVLTLAREATDSLRGEGMPHAAHVLEALPHPSDRCVQVAHNLVPQLAARFEFIPPGPDDSAYRRCLGARALDADALPGLTGRAVEILQFKGVIEATAECQDGHIVYVRGTAGVGKTRLLAEFVDIARQNDFALHRADVLDFGMESWFSPLRQLVRGLLGVGGTPAVELRSAMQVALARWRMPAEHVAFLQMLAGAAADTGPLAAQASTGQGDGASGITRALQALLVRMALERPMLVCIEDLHWADAHLLHVLGDLLATTDEAPIVWVLTSRSEGDPLEQALRPRFDNPLTLLDLGPLRPRESSALADQFTAVDPAYRADCLERAQGNPLYLIQLLSEPEHRLPDTLKHLVQARLDRLAPVHQQALKLAAVLGNRCELAVLRAAMRQDDYVLDRGARHGLMQETEPGRYAFVHDLVMRCIYDALGPAQRDHLHRSVARLFRERDPVLHAQHLLRGRDPSAFAALLAAMRERLDAYQYETTLDLAEQCDAFAVQASASFALALLRAQACAGAGRTAQARQHFQRAMMLADRPADRIEAVLGLAPVLNMLDQLDEEEQLLDATFPLARAQCANAALARLQHLKGNLCFPRGDYAACRHHHEEALRHARTAKDLETEARALSGIADSSYAQGRMLHAHEVFDQCVRLCERHGLANVAAAGLGARGSCDLYLGRPRTALQDSQDSIARAIALGSRRVEVFSRLTAAWILVAGDETERARAELSGALDIARGMGANRFVAVALEGLARVALQEEDPAAAWECIERARTMVESLRLQNFIGPWICGTAALITDDASTRKRVLEQGEALLANDCLAHNALRFYVAAAETALLDGDVAQADRYATKMRAYSDCPWVTHHERLVDAAGKRLLHPDATTERTLQATLRQARQLGFSATMPRLMRKLESC